MRRPTQQCLFESDRPRWEESEIPKNLVPILVDITEAKLIEQASEAVAEAIGDRGLAGLVNNVGVVVGGPTGRPAGRKGFS